MKKVMSVLMAVLVGVVFATGAIGAQTFDEAVAAASVLYNAKDWAGASTAYADILKKFPNVPADKRVGIEYALGHSLRCEGKVTEAMAAFDVVVSDPDASVGMKANGLYFKSYGYNVLKEFDKAYALYEKMLADYPTAPVGILTLAKMGLVSRSVSQGKYSEAQAALEAILQNTSGIDDYTIGNVQLALANALKYQGKTAEEQTVLKKLVQDYAWKLGAASRAGQIWAAFDRINPKLMTTSDYKAFLEDVIKSIPAKTNNAEFLGRLKSELEKIK